MTEKLLSYIIKDPLELNLSYMPFITNGGLFVPTIDTYVLGDIVALDLMLPGRNEIIRIEGKVIWITPKNAMHHVLAGVGIQFIGDGALAIKAQLESTLDTKMEVGGYTYGILGSGKNS